MGGGSTTLPGTGPHENRPGETGWKVCGTPPDSPIHVRGQHGAGRALGLDPSGTVWYCLHPPSCPELPCPHADPAWKTTPKSDPWRWSCGTRGVCARAAYLAPCTPPLGPLPWFCRARGGHGGTPSPLFGYGECAGGGPRGRRGLEGALPGANRWCVGVDRAT